MSGADYYTEWNEGQGPVTIEDVTDATIQADSSTLESLTVAISDLTDIGFEWLAADVSGTSIADSYDSSTGVLSLTGTDTVENYEQVLRTITYDNTAVLATGYDRTIQFEAYDGLGNFSNLANALVLFLFQAEDEPDVTEVEFVAKEDLNLTNVKNANLYGKLLVGTNPDGDVNNDGVVDGADKTRNALREPEFKGGDRFFPGATIDKPNLGKNIVRVRATVTNMAVGDKVLFRSFDVDDPSSDQHIDNSDAGEDNRGRLPLGNAPHRPLQSRRPAVDNSPNGRLRSVNLDENGVDDVAGDWAADGVIVEALVKMLNNGELVAEVDLVTTFAPGDNYRVYVVPERLRARLENAHTKATGEGRVETNENSPYDAVGDDPHLTPQLSVWRYLHSRRTRPTTCMG